MTVTTAPPNAGPNPERRIVLIPPPRGTTGSLVLTRRDEELLLWVARFGPVTREQIGRRFFPSMKRCYRRVLRTRASRPSPRGSRRSRCPSRRPDHQRRHSSGWRRPPIGEPRPRENSGTTSASSTSVSDFSGTTPSRRGLQNGSCGGTGCATLTAIPLSASGARPTAYLSSPMDGAWPLSSTSRQRGRVSSTNWRGRMRLSASWPACGGTSRVRLPPRVCGLWSPPSGSIV